MSVAKGIDEDRTGVGAHRTGTVVRLVRGANAPKQLGDPSAQTHSKDFRDHYPLGRPTIGTAEVSSLASQREAKPPLHLLSESVR
jgi:hypothetical protein